MPTTEWPRSSSASQRCEPMNPAAPVTTILHVAHLMCGGLALDQTALRWKRPRTRVSHMILRSSVTDQFSM